MKKTATPIKKVKKIMKKPAAPESTRASTAANNKSQANVGRAWHQSRLGEADRKRKSRQASAAAKKSDRKKCVIKRARRAARHNKNFSARKTEDKKYAITAYNAALRAQRTAHDAQSKSLRCLEMVETTNHEVKGVKNEVKKMKADLAETKKEVKENTVNQTVIAALAQHNFERLNTEDRTRGFVTPPSGTSTPWGSPCE